MNISKTGIDLIKSFESCRLTAYKAVKTEKLWTIGWGHYGVNEGLTITQSEADRLFEQDLQKYVKYTNTYTSGLNQNQFDALVSFCYNCGPGNLIKLVSGRTAEEVAEHIPDFNKSGGKVLTGLVRRREAEKALFCKSVQNPMSIIMIGSARIDENGNTSGGKAGDQKQAGTGNDTKGEVSNQSFYVHSKGWYVLRPKDPAHAELIAIKMIEACNNSNIGYDQSGRLGVIQNGIGTKVPTECDCSSLVRACIKEATGKDPGNFNTSNEVEIVVKTDLFNPPVEYKSGMELCAGDVLVTKTKGHTAIVTNGNQRTSKKYYPAAVGSNSLTELLKSIGVNPSFEHRKQIALANGLFSYTGTAEQNILLVEKLKNGKLIRG